MAGVVTAVCFSLNYIIIYWTFYKKMPIRARPYSSVSITQRWGVESLPLLPLSGLLSKHVWFSVYNFASTAKKKSPFEGDYTPSNFVAQFLLVLSLCGIVIYIILVVVVMVFLG